MSSHPIIYYDSSFPVLVRLADEPARRERHQQRLRSETVGLQHGVRALRLHQPTGIGLQVHHRQAIGRLGHMKEPRKT